jgi:hypothetical protein
VDEPKTVSSPSIASARALGEGIGNRSLARLLSGQRQIVLARALTIEGTRHEARDYYGFSSKLRGELNSWGYTTPSRLLRIVQVALGRLDLIVDERELVAAEALTKQSYANWSVFVETLAQGNYTSGVIPSASKLRRPYKLGKRPTWIRKIATLIPPEKKQARRHVIPSHLLGYVVENWKAKPELILGWIRQAELIQPSLVDEVLGGRSDLDRLGEFQLKRLVWRILSNHTGNIWWGETVDNTAIGFLAPHIEKLLDELTAIEVEAGLHDVKTYEELREVSKPLVERAVELVKRVPDMKGDTDLAKRWNVLKDQIRFVTDFDAMSDIIEGVEEVFFGMELDPTRIKDTPEVLEISNALGKVDDDGTQFLAFLGKVWPNTINA